MHVCLFTIPKPTTCTEHSPQAACPDMAGQGPPALLLRCGGRRGHTTRGTGRKAVEREGRRREGEAVDRWDTGHTPPHHSPKSQIRESLVHHNLASPTVFSVSMCITSYQVLDGAFSLCLECLNGNARTTLETPSIYTTLPTSRRGASSKPQTNPSSLSPSADKTLESR